MPDHSQQDFATTELDPHLLSTPFGVHTNWQVITGGPSCGKTTLINLLANKGFRTAPEGADCTLRGRLPGGKLSRKFAQIWSPYSVG
jgi:hypothetical protein